MNCYLYGASGHGKVVKEILESHGIIVEAFVDDNHSINQLGDKRVIHEAKGLSPLIVTIGDNKIRKQIVSKLSCEFISAIHPKAIISPSVFVDKGSVIVAGAIINAEAKIGKHCIINTGASVGHDCIISDFVHIAPHSTLCGGSEIGECTWIGAGTTVIQGIHIGKNCFIGAGSVVVEDIPDGCLCYGNPARVIKKIK